MTARAFALLAVLATASGCFGSDRTFPDESADVVRLHVNAYAETDREPPTRGIVEVSGLGADGDNYPVPEIAAEDWQLRLRGFERDATLGIDDLLALPRVAHEVVLECAGNGRTWFSPKPEGTAWRERAVACARFKGAPLAAVLERAGVPADAVEIVFKGADGPFERSLPREVALAPDTMLAWEMNGEPLRATHGAPVRLVVPSWYGVASVKWLVDIRASATPFQGHYQTERYVFARSKDDKHPTPVREKRVNSLVVSPAPEATVEAGRPLTIAGWAWSGSAPIASVEVSIDGGATWHAAQLSASVGPHAWRGWLYVVTPHAGDITILARAKDEAGNAQPEKVDWNLHGYAYNAPRPRRVRAVARARA